MRQAGALPFRHGPDGLRVLLITSRDTGRWVIPKGHVEPGQTAAIAAAVEAYEEAGLAGAVSNMPLGIYTYGKRLRSGVVLPATVEVYSLEVGIQMRKWPERKQRRLQWMDVETAAALVQEAGLSVLMHRLAEVV
ncbi:NUDIX hydrolase [Acidocella sp.]|uniref:NUDIX hydrolase n=1 Tax=Acidocella sp. TaxID=50710 RepID=UPI002F4035D0